MENNNQIRFTTIETDKSIKIMLPPPGFKHPITVIFTVINVLLLLNLSAIVYGIYYADIVLKLGLIIFSLPWVGFGVIINFVLVKQFTNKTTININYEEIRISSSSKYKTFKVEEIINITIVKSNKTPENMYAKLFIVTNDGEYDIHKGVGFIFTNQEIVWLANKINKYIQKSVTK